MELTLEQALLRGIEAHKAGDAKEADRYYTAILKADPKHSDANHNMGVLAVDLEKASAALPFFRNAVESDPSVPQYWKSYIEALISLGRLENAQVVLAEAKLSGIERENLSEKIEISSEEIPQEPSQEELQSIFSLFQMGQYQLALSKASQMVKVFPLSVSLYNLIGAAYQNQGKSKEAIESYNKVFSIQPNNAQAHYNMGVVLKEEGRLDDALISFSEALSIAPNYVQAYSNIGAILQGQGRVAEAIESYEKSLAIDPVNKQALSNIGIALKEQGKLDEAVKAYKRALTIDPENAEVFNNMGNALKEQDKLDEAAESYKKALSIKPDYATAYYNLAVMNQAQGKLSEAVKIYRKALEINPNYIEAYTNMGIVLQKQGKLSEALETYYTVLNIDPNSSEAYSSMGIVFQEQGKLGKAIEAYEKAISINPGSLDAYNNMGIVFQEQGKRDEAIEAYEKVLSIKSDFMEARSNLAILLFSLHRYEEAAHYFSLSDSIKDQSYLLECLYNLDKESEFYDQLQHLIKRGVNNCLIGSYASRAEIRYGKKHNNPFCNRPLDHVLISDLTQKCNFEKTFVENASNVLSNSEVAHKSQGLLKNGIQTSGNIFSQVGSITSLWQDIIKSEIENYREYFRESNEGFIKDWPSDYNLFGWLISMKNGGELAAHIHETGWISGSIYINVPPKSKVDSGNLVVTTHKSEDGKVNAEDLKDIDVITGSLCLFPSSLLHFTKPFESSENRIVLAFDMIPNR